MTEERYRYLKGLLPARFHKINEDNITTIKFRPADVRVRYSDRLREVVWKDTDPTKEVRNEVTIRLNTIEDCHKMVSLLEAAGLSQHPSWTTERADFVCSMDGHEYTLSLQHIPNFAYLLEAEIMTDQPQRHIPNLKKILSGLGCEPLDADQFKERIKGYIAKFSKEKH